ncbi:MAG: hypothetical protein ABIW76_08555 [Fibrobacteria bacterium]
MEIVERVKPDFRVPSEAPFGVGIKEISAEESLGWEPESGGEETALRVSTAVKADLTVFTVEKEES